MVYFFIFHYLPTLWGKNHYIRSVNENPGLHRNELYWSQYADTAHNAQISEA